MHLVEIPLLSSAVISHCILGFFSGTKAQQEVALIRGTSVLEILSSDPQTGRLISLIKKNLFGTVRTIQPFRMIGSSKDYMIVGSDSGRVSILEYVPEKNSLDILALETFGRSGCRRSVPGQFLAIDPKGRAFLICAIEKTKFAYILNRDASSRFVISSPLDCHKSHTMSHFITALDVGFENPIFVALESFLQAPGQDLVPESERMLLVYYELDLGLNHMVRKAQVPISHSSHFLLSLPATSSGSVGPSGPGGLLVFSLGIISWHSTDYKVKPFTLEFFPMKTSLVSTASLHKTKNAFFVLFQLESGDLFKLTIDYHDDQVTEIEVKYFDSIKPCRSIAILRSGFLLAAAEQSSNQLFQIVGLAENETQRWNTKDSVENLSLVRREALTNLAFIEEEPSLSPIVDTKVLHFPGEESPRIITVGGTGPSSRLTAIRHGIEVSEIAVTELPLGSPTGIWTLGRSNSGYTSLGPTRFIIVSFSNCTTVLVVDESVEEDQDSPFSLSQHPTIYIAPLTDGSVIQVLLYFDTDIRLPPAPLDAFMQMVHVRQAGLRVQEHSLLMHQATVHSLVLFSLDAQGKFTENNTHKQLENQIITIALSGTPWNAFGNLSIVGVCTEGDQIIRLFSIGPAGLDLVALQALNTGLVSSLAFAIEFDPSVNDKKESLFLYAGLTNGILIRFTVEGTVMSGLSLSDPRTRFIGPTALNLQLLPSLQNSNGFPSLVILSAKPWIMLHAGLENCSKLLPINYLNISHAAMFSTEDAPLGLLGVSGSTLRIISFDRLFYNEERSYLLPPILQPYLSISLPASPRRLSIVDGGIFGTLNPLVLLICSELIKKEATETPPSWISFIKIYDIQSGLEQFSLQMPSTETALCGSLIKFHGEQRLFYALGTAVNYSQMPFSFESAWIHIYEVQTQINSNDMKINFELVHKTQLEEPPASFCVFRGRLLVGMGQILRLYDLGKKRLLRKSENRSLPFRIYSVSVPGSPVSSYSSNDWLFNSNANRVVISDVQYSILIAMYKPEDNCFYLIADDPIPRWPSCAHLPLDYDTNALADKFGNLSILRLPAAVSEAIDSDISGARLLDRSHLLGAPNKIENICHAYIGDTITSLNKALLVWSSGREVLLYTTITGAIGAMLPLLTREDVNFFQRLELHLRAATTNLIGRDHLAYRSTFSPSKHIIDGALLAYFNSLPEERKERIASDLEVSPLTISKKIEELRITYTL